MTKAILSFISAVILTVFSVTAQRLDTLYLIDTALTANDNIGIGAAMYFTSSECNLEDWEFEVAGYDLHLKAYYRVGTGARPCETTDTLFIGSLPSGDYQLVFEALSSSGIHRAADTLHFSVEKGTGLDERHSRSELRVYPNPVGDILSVRTGRNIRAMTIFNSSGRHVRTYSPGERQLDISALSSGLYLLQLQTDSGIEVLKVVVK